jgi:hypothetical protein
LVTAGLIVAAASVAAADAGFPQTIAGIAILAGVSEWRRARGSTTRPAASGEDRESGSFSRRARSVREIGRSNR